MQTPHVSSSVGMQGVSDGLVTLSFVRNQQPLSSLPVFFFFFAVAPVPQDPLVNYTWALPFNMGWNIPEFPASNTSSAVLYSLLVTHSNKWGGGARVWHSGKSWNYSLALYFALFASLLILVFNNSGANAELQISSRKHQINWPSL